MNISCLIYHSLPRDLYDNISYDSLMYYLSNEFRVQGAVSVHLLSCFSYAVTLCHVIEMSMKQLTW